MNKAIVAFGASFAVAGLLTYAHDSNASFWSRQDESSCHAWDSNDYLSGQNYSTSGTEVLECPVTDTAVNPKTSITTFNVHVDASSGSVWVFRCVNYWNATGGACGNTAFSSGSGVQAVSPPSFSGWSVADFGQVDVFLPPETSGGVRSGLKGYYTANP